MADRIAHRLRRAGPRRAEPGCCWPTGRGPDWICWCTTGLADGCCPSCRRCGWSATSTTGTRTSTQHSLTVLEQAIEPGARGCRERPGPDQPAGRAAARHRQAGDPAVRAGRQGVVPPPRRGRRQAGPEAADRAAVQHRRGRGGRPSWSSCTCASTATASMGTGVDRLRRPPLRPRRRRPAGAAAHPDPGRLHDPEPGARRPGCGAAYDDLEQRIDELARAGGAERAAARPRRQPDHGDPRHPAGRGRRRGVPVPAGAPDRRGPLGPRARRGRAPHLVVRPSSSDSSLWNARQVGEKGEVEVSEWAGSRSWTCSRGRAGRRRRPGSARSRAAYASRPARPRRSRPPRPGCSTADWWPG